MDYMVLNEAIVTDRYPIPVVDELRDKLFGNYFF